MKKSCFRNIANMPGAIEEIKVEGDVRRHKAWKLSHLFQLKSRLSKKQKTPEERRDQLDRDMQSNWEQLPATLRRRRERMSQAVLDMFTEDDTHLESDSTSDRSSENKQANQQDISSLESDGSSSPEATVLTVQPEIHREGSISSLDDTERNAEGKSIPFAVLRACENMQTADQILSDIQTEKLFQNLHENSVLGNQEQNVSSDSSHSDVKNNLTSKAQCSKENKNIESALLESGLLKQCQVSEDSEKVEEQLRGDYNLEEKKLHAVGCVIETDHSSEQENNVSGADSIDKTELETNDFKNKDSKPVSYDSSDKFSKTCTSINSIHIEETEQLVDKDSQDSLLVSSPASSSLSPSSTSSSSVDNEEQNVDSGTDINSPSQSSSTESHLVSYCKSQNSHSNYNIPNNSCMAHPKYQTELELMHSQITKKHQLSKVQASRSQFVFDNNGSKIKIEDGKTSPSQNVINDANKIISSEEDSELYEVAIPRVEFNHCSNSLNDCRLPQTYSKELQPSCFQHEDLPALNDTKEIGEAEEDVLSYYDSIVQEEQANVEEKDHIDDIKTETKSCYSLLSRTTGINMEFSGFYKNDFIHAVTDELESHPKEIVVENGSQRSDKVVQIKVLPFDFRWKPKLYGIETMNKKLLSTKMTTILEEKEGEFDTPEKMSVREILQRFEKIGCDNGTKRQQEDDRTLLEIHETLRCLEEKVRLYTSASTQEVSNDASFGKMQQKAVSHLPDAVIPSKVALDAWTGHSRHHQPAPILQPHATSPVQHSSIVTASSPQPSETPSRHDGKHSLLQFAMLYFRQSPEKFEMLKRADGSISGSLKVIENIKTSNKKNKGKNKSNNKENDWTWKEQVDLVKFSLVPIEQSLLRLEPGELSDLAVECFTAVMRYMGDLPMVPDSSEVKCVYTILMHCHKHETLRDEVYCQLMKQTTNNKSAKPDSCQRGWRLFSIVAAYFTCSDILKPYLFKYLETAAYDKRRAYHGTATVCLQNLRKTFKYGGRKNVPSVEEITAISAGRNSKRQIYRLPGGTERVVNTKSTTVVQDVIEELCTIIGVMSGDMEMEEFSLYCIVEGDTFTMPLAREEYILDVTTELHKNQQVFYLIFCRSVWHFPLRLDSQLYVEVVFNQIAPDYLEGLLLVMPGEQLQQDVIYDIAKIAALLHRAADMSHVPTMKETKFLLPKPALTVRDVKPAQWVNMVQGNWHEVEMLSVVQAKAQVLDILSKWPLFGSSFFAVKRVSDPKDRSDHILALNRHGVHFIDLVTHETLAHYPFSEVISTRKVKSEDGTLFLDMKCGNLMQQRITRLQTDQAHEISRLIRQYITMEQRLRHG